MLLFIKKHLLIIVIAGALLFILLFTQGDKPPQEYETAAESVPSPAEEPAGNDETDTVMVVDVKGEVNQPGVYEAEQGMRVHDVIDEAGGFTDAALELAVNLAEKVHDEMIIIIPNEDDHSEGIQSQTAHGDKVRINQADQGEIETLSGIGPSKAEAIINHRDEHGSFQTVEDLLDVSGIGEKTLENLQADIQIP